MANNDDSKETATRGNDWEVVSLTASAYAAAPGPEKVELDEGNQGNTIGDGEPETSNALFMSRHFVFPPNQHENLPVEPEPDEVQVMQGAHFFTAESEAPQLDATDLKNQKAVGNKELNVSSEFPGIPIFDEKGNILSASAAEFEESAALRGLNLMEKEHGFYSSARFDSYETEVKMDESSAVEEGVVLNEPMEIIDTGSVSGISNFPKSTDKDEYGVSGLPCEAWWKRRAASWVSQAKEANAFWSIFIAAAVMGLVILGQRWQQERWQAMQLKWQFGIKDEVMGKMLGPMSRLKDVIVGGERRGSFIRGRTAAEH